MPRNKTDRLKRAMDNGATIYLHGTDQKMRYLPRADQPGGRDTHPWVNAWGDRFDGTRLEARAS